MSKGLGRIQRLILKNLDKAMDDKVSVFMEKFYEPTVRCLWYPTVVYQGKTFEIRRDIKTLRLDIIPASVFDLEIVSRYLADRHSGTDYGFIASEWSATFSRAVRRLVRDGWLMVMPPMGSIGGKKIRFVCKTQKTLEYLEEIDHPLAPVSP